MFWASPIAAIISFVQRKKRHYIIWPKGSILYSETDSWWVCQFIGFWKGLTTFKNVCVYESSGSKLRPYQIITMIDFINSPDKVINLHQQRGK